MTSRIAKGVLFQQVGEETVLLHPCGEQYFGLDPVGTRVWQLLADSDDLGKIIDTLLEEYDVDREVLEADVERLLAELAEAGLVVLERG